MCSNASHPPRTGKSLHGIGASRGLAIGRALVRQQQIDIAKKHIPAVQVQAELDRLHRAIDGARAEMQALRERLLGALVQEVGDILDLHALLLDDPELIRALDESIRHHRYTAEYALFVQRKQLKAIFQGMEDAYLKSRMDDLDHVISRIHAFLQQHPTKTKGLVGQILVSDNVAPSELAELQAHGVVGIVTVAGSLLSHNAILARSLHLPFVIGAGETIFARVKTGDALIIDGRTGNIIVDPTPHDIRACRSRLRDLAKEQRQLDGLRHAPTQTRDQIAITLRANAESIEDITHAHALGADGLGLYRTEFLFLQRTELPDEEEQFQAYRNIVMSMSGRVVTVRTLDLGSDKADRSGITLSDEANPALGLRGIRLSLANPTVSKTQLRAILRASGYGPVRILIPMLTDRDELVQFRRQMNRQTKQLRQEGHDIAPRIDLGAMIEIPAAAIALETLIDQLDFLSIGTNDLVQYLLAADRNNDAVAQLYTPLHPAVLHLISHIIDVARQHQTPVAVCGEIAGDPRYVPILLALGLTDFSLHPATLLEIRRAIRASHYGELRKQAKQLLRARDRRGIEAWLATNDAKLDI